MSDNAVNAGLRRMGYTKDTMTGHGFRAMARTMLDEGLHVRPDYIEHQLAHDVRDPNGRACNRTAHLEERRKMMQQWADYLDQLKSGAQLKNFKIGLTKSIIVNSVFFKNQEMTKKEMNQRVRERADY